MYPTKIVISNDGMGPSKGDQAILMAMLDRLKEDIPDAHIEVFPHSNMRRPGQYLEFCLALRNADVFLFGGGQGLQDQASVAFLISGLLKLVLAKALCGRVCCYAQGVGPLASPIGRALTRLVLNRVDLVLLRDEDSLRSLRELGVTKPPCFVTTDPALTLMPASETRAREILRLEQVPEADGPRIAIAPRRWFHYRHYFLPMSYRARFCSLQRQERNAEIKEAIAHAADGLVSRLRAQVIFVPMRRASSRFDPGQDDDRVSEEIMERMRSQESAFLIRGDYSPREVKALLGQMDVAVGMRLHSLLLAAMMGVPVVGVALTPKFGPFFDLLGQSKYLLAPDEVTGEVLLEHIIEVLARREQISRHLASRRGVLEVIARSNERHVRELLARKG